MTGSLIPLATECLIVDPTTKRQRPRAYVRSLEERCATLERLLQAASPEVANDHLGQVVNMNDISKEPLVDNSYSPFSANVANDTGGTGTGNQLNRISVTAGIITSVATAESEHDDPSNLSSEVGLLCLNAVGRVPHYFGPSSSFSFSRILSSGLSRLSSRPSLHSDNANEQSYSIRTTCPPEPLPSRSVGAMLSKIYFANINTQYPFLHQPTFAQWEDELMSAHETGDLSRLNPSTSYFVFMVCLNVEPVLQR
jgi:hypothetical protein